MNTAREYVDPYEGYVRIRASSLPSYDDCGLRTAASLWAKDFKADGFEVRDLPAPIGAVVGTAVHAAALHILKTKMETGAPGALQPAVDAALAAFDEEMKDGALYDDTTRNIDSARAQVGRITAVHLHYVAPSIEPLIVEEAMQADLGNGFLFTGHVDVFTKDLVVDDLKTGAVDRSYMQQLGGYSLLVRSTPSLPNPKDVRQTWIQRVRPSKAQPKPVLIDFDMDASERAAHTTILRMKADYTAYTESSDPLSFPRNASSLLCSDRYCPAWGTKTCINWRPKET